MARGVELIELKYHDNFNLIEPGFVKACHENIGKYYQVYYGILNKITSLKSEAEGVLVLKGRDFLTEKFSELESDIREITSICDNIHNMKLYDLAVEKRADILNAKQNIIEAERNKAISTRNSAQKELDSKFLNGPASPFHQDLWDKINRAEKIIAECNEDLDIINNLRGKDYNG